MTPEYKQRFWAKVQKTQTCWNWTASLTTHGYGQASHPYKKGWPLAAYRVAWMMAYGQVPKGMCVCHKCDNPLCVRPTHLFLGKQRDNLADMRRKERGYVFPIRRGEKAKHAKLTTEQVKEIRRLYREGQSLRTLGRRFNVWYTTISVIVRRKTWHHLR